MTDMLRKLTPKSYEIPFSKGWAYGVREAEIPEGFWGGTDMAIYSQDGLIETRRSYTNYGSALAGNAYPWFYPTMNGVVYLQAGAYLYNGQGAGWTTITGYSAGGSPSRGSFAPLSKNKIVFCENTSVPYTITISANTAAVTTGSSLTDCTTGVCCSHLNRVWIAGGGTSPYPYGKIWYSVAGDPDDAAGYTGTYYVNCGEIGVEQILAMHSVGQIMYVVKQNSLWAMMGTRLTGDDFTVVSRERFFYGGSVVGGNVLYVLGSNGLYAVQGTQAQRIPMPFEWLFASHVRNNPTWYLSYWEKMGWLFLSFPDSTGVYDTYLYIYDTRKGIWYFWDNPGLHKGISTSKGEFVTAHYHSKQLRDWGELLLVGSGGSVQEATLTSNLKTPWTNLGNPTSTKFLSSIIFDSTADRCDVHMRTATDTGLGTAVYTTTIDHTGKAIYAPLARWFKEISLKLYRSDNTAVNTRRVIINYYEVEI